MVIRFFTINLGPNWDTLLFEKLPKALKNEEAKMEERTMIDGLWPHPVEDADGDKHITAKEKCLYFLKMIPWTVAALLFPVISHAVKTGVSDLLPVAVSLATEIAKSAITGGDAKASDFNAKMEEAAISEGRQLAASEINWLRENAVQIIKGE